ncbi:MAG: hypothetical protein M1820_007684 [Bogoriella megaspora]|nr:MAG: hypothetical protein M1820_007684 [Bogoriella megaspora]
MEVAAGVVVAEQLVTTAVEGAVVGGFLAARRTLPLKGTFTRIANSQDEPSPETLHRISHTLNIVNGHAYIFGGSFKDERNGPIAGNEMHIIRVSGKFGREWDYKCVPAIPSIEGNDVPNGRKSHSAAVYGDQILVFGGPNENGRVWSFDTQSLTWTARDPSDVRFCQVSQHQGAIVLEDRFIVHGSAYQAVSHLQETWAFDLTTNTWNHIASLRTEGEQTFTKPAIHGKSIFSISMRRDPQLSEHSVWLHYLCLDGQKPPEWESIQFSVEPLSGPLIYQGSPLLPISTGLGRHYLLFQGGRAANFNIDAEKQPDTSDETGLWTMQIPSDDRSLAKLKDWVRSKVGKGHNSGDWAEVEIKVTNKDKSKETTHHPGPRTHSAMAALDERTVMLFAGKYPGFSEGQVDGWIIKLE